MRHSTFVVEGEFPVVFSPSPDSPVAPYLVEYQPRSIAEMYKFQLIPTAVREEHLEEACEAARRVSVPNAVLIDESGRWYGDHSIPGRIITRRKAAIAEQAIQKAAGQLERMGYEASVAKLTAQKAAPFLPHVDLVPPIWRIAELSDLEVRGVLYIDRRIAALRARNIFVAWNGWIVPEGNYCLIKCDEIKGEPTPHFKVPRYEQILEFMSGIGPRPPEPVEGWTDRLSIAEIRRQAAHVTSDWR